MDLDFDKMNGLVPVITKFVSKLFAYIILFVEVVVINATKKEILVKE